MNCVNTAQAKQKINSFKMSWSLEKVRYLIGDTVD
jgi:hypothetical protein